MAGSLYRTLLGNSVCSIAMMTAVAASAQEGPSYTTFGTPGLIEMPTAESADPSEITATLAYSPTSGYKTSFAYQLTNRLSGAFRYSVVDQYRTVTDPDVVPGTYETFDRSFDIKYRLLDESQYAPAIAVGLRDFLGTGRYSSEYIVASKSLGPNLIVTSGLGWGRMATNNGFKNPLGSIDASFYDRPGYVDREFADEGEGNGGLVSSGQFFRGDAAFFGGFEYQISDKLGVKAEYSSIGYPVETFAVAANYQSPLNFGLTYRPTPSTEVNLAYLYGTEVSLGVTMMLNPEERPTYSGLDTAPVPVRVRTADQRAAQTWDRAQQPEPAVRANLTKLLEVEGIDLIGLEITDSTARLRFENTRYRSEAQAMGRAARTMTQVIPPSVNTFILEPSQKGIALSRATLLRSDVERLENQIGAADELFERTQFSGAGSSDGLVKNERASPRFRWGVAPYLDLTIFGSDSPLSPVVGLEAAAEYDVTSNLMISGKIRQSFMGAQDALDFTDIENDYANVRTDEAFYGRHGGPVLSYLTATYFTQFAPEVYGRVTAGYLERMYGGISTEVLYAPVDTRWAVGAELNYVAMRDQDMGFGFAQYRTVRENGVRTRVLDGDYTSVNGHLSVYYDIGHGFHAQADIGRYLAGDWGGTLSLKREFENGWEIGGYVTLTDMPFDQFGEGSFDKGIVLTIPYDYFIGTPSRQSASTTLQSLSRDGGAKLRLQDRLYENVREGRVTDLEDTWGRFWR